jgi:alanine dehydrogenase
MRDIIDLMEDTFKLYYNNKASMPSKLYLFTGEGDFRAMPALVNDVSGIKWVSVYPNNNKHNLPTVLATMMLNDAKTGKLLLTMDGVKITTYRTAAVTGLATRYLSRPDSKEAAFIGCGAQTLYQIQAICSERDIEKIHLYDLDHKASERLGSEIDASSLPNASNSCCSLYVNFRIHNSIQECVEQADIITTLTPSTKPIIKSEWIKRGAHINAVGADAKGKQEFNPDIFEDCKLIVVDDKEQAFHSGETQHSPPGTRDSMVELKDVISALSHFSRPEKCCRLKKEDTTLFDSTGLAIEDVALTNYIYKNFVKY